MYGTRDAAQNWEAVFTTMSVLLTKGSTEKDVVALEKAAAILNVGNVTTLSQYQLWPDQRLALVMPAQVCAVVDQVLAAHALVREGRCDLLEVVRAQQHRQLRRRERLQRHPEGPAPAERLRVVLAHLVAPLRGNARGKLRVVEAPPSLINHGIL